MNARSIVLTITLGLASVMNACSQESRLPTQVASLQLEPSRYSELIGHPQKIKRILCESATDLGRERTFQGHGMLDVLRAFQAI